MKPFICQECGVRVESVYGQFCMRLEFRRVDAKERLRTVTTAYVCRDCAHKLANEAGDIRAPQSQLPLKTTPEKAREGIEMAWEALGGKEER